MIICQSLDFESMHILITLCCEIGSPTVPRTENPEKLIMELRNIK